MSNSLLTMDMITRKALQLFENQAPLLRTVNRQYDNSFAQSGAKIGDTLRIRKPNRFLVRDGAALGVQDANEQNGSLTISSQKGVDLNFTTAEMALSLDDFSERYIKPAIAQLAATVESDLSNVFKYIGNSVGTPGTTPATSAVLLTAGQKLNEFGIPLDRRYATVNPAANAALVEGMKGLFNPSGVVSGQFKSGMMGQGILGFDEFNMSQSIKNFTCGSRVAATTSAVVSTEGATTIALTISGGTASDTILQGDVFTVADCYAVNPLTRESTGSLFQFVAAADATASGSAVSVTVLPVYSASSALATVNALPGNAKTVTFLGTASTAYPQNLIYHKDSIVLATADLMLPGGVDMASRANHNGISLRIVRAYDINNDRMPCRIDILYGYGVIRPESACRLWG